jgi:uncharacterized membrane protein YiaA
MVIQTGLFHQSKDFVMENKRKTSSANADQSLTIYLAEYESLWTEIMARFDAQKQILNLQILVIGASVSAVEVFNGEPVLYLFAAILLGLLSWIMIEQTVRNQTLNYYLQNVLTKKIKEVAKDPKLAPLEYFDWAYQTNWRNILVGIISQAKFFMGFLLAFVFIALFFAVKLSNNQLTTSSENILFIASIIVLFIPALVGVISGLSLLRKPK